MTRDLAGKTFLLTGATLGIGAAAAQAFAQRGADLVLVGRSAEKLAAARAELSKHTDVDTIVADLSLVSETRRVAAEFRARRDRLHALVNNAGGIFQTRQVTAEGFEHTFALNHLAYFVLTTELWDVLARTSGARVVSTASGAHMGGRIDVNDVAWVKRRYSAWAAYANSKLANVMFTREAARRAAGSFVANCVHPGWVYSGFGLNEPGLVARAISFAGPLFARTTEKGAETIIWAAASPEASALNGEYLTDRRVARPSAAARDEAQAQALWSLSERLVAQIPRAAA